MSSWALFIAQKTWMKRGEREEVAPKIWAWSAFWIARYHVWKLEKYEPLIDDVALISVPEFPLKNITAAPIRVKWFLQSWPDTSHHRQRSTWSDSCNHGLICPIIVRDPREMICSIMGWHITSRVNDPPKMLLSNPLLSRHLRAYKIN